VPAIVFPLSESPGGRPVADHVADPTEEASCSEYGCPTTPVLSAVVVMSSAAPLMVIENSRSAYSPGQFVPARRTQK
jgi:hypothetical protein